MNLRPSGYEPDELPLLHPASRSQTITDLAGGVKLTIDKKAGHRAWHKA